MSWDWGWGLIIGLIIGFIVGTAIAEENTSASVGFEIVIPKSINTSNPQNVIITDTGTIVSP